MIHFDAASDAKAYLHRSGRTARAGADGCVVTLTTPKMVAQVVRHQRDAKVDVLLHDLRSVPQPMTADALAASGTSAPPTSHGSARKPYAGKKPYGKQGASRGGYKRRVQGRPQERATRRFAPRGPPRDVGQARPRVPLSLSLRTACAARR